MHSLFRVPDIDTMSQYSCITEKSMASTESMGINAQNEFSPSKYSIKTLCFSKASSTMPTKEEYSVLLSCGLGARKWQVRSDFDKEDFQNAIYKIYPRLNSVSGYTLRNIKKDKTFEELPAMVNTPRRIRSYLGNQFSGCLVIIPTEEIQLFDHPLQSVKSKSCQYLTNCNQQLNQNSERQLSQMTELTNELRFYNNSNKTEKRFRSTVLDMMERNALSSSKCTEDNEQEHLTDQESGIYSDSELSSPQRSQKEHGSHKRHHAESPVRSAYPYSALNLHEPQHQSNYRSNTRDFCLVCGKLPTQTNASSFVDVENCNLQTDNGEKENTTLSQKLSEVIKISESQRHQLIPSKDVCNKCFRQLNYISFMENQIKRVKEEMLGNFFATLTKFNMGNSNVPPTSSYENTYTSNNHTSTSNGPIYSTSNLSYPRSHNTDEANSHRQNGSNQQNRFSTLSTRTLNSNEWNRSSSNTPSPPASSGSVGSIDTSGSVDLSSDDTQQEMPALIPRPFWKKRYCKDSNKSSTQHGKSNDANNNHSSSSGTEQTQDNQVKRRKVERCTDDATNIKTENEDVDVNEAECSSTHSSEHVHKRKRKAINDYEKQRSIESSHKFLAPNIYQKRDLNRQRS